MSNCVKVFKEHQQQPVESAEEREEVERDSKVDFTVCLALMVMMLSTGYVYCLPTIDAQPTHLI